MFDKSIDDRLRAWVEFRNTLETSDNPIQDVVDLYDRAPLVNFQVDPYDQKNWPDPWTLLYENEYCDFAKILGIAATLKLTDRFSDTEMMIHIYTDREKSEVKYMLFINNKVVGYELGNVVDNNKIPSTMIFDISFQYTINR